MSIISNSTNKSRDLNVNANELRCGINILIGLIYYHNIPAQYLRRRLASARKMGTMRMTITARISGTLMQCFLINGSNV